MASSSNTHNVATKLTTAKKRVMKKRKTSIHDAAYFNEYNDAVEKLLQVELPETNNPLQFTIQDLRQILSLGKKRTKGNLPRTQNSYLLYQKGMRLQMKRTPETEKLGFERTSKLFGQNWKNEGQDMKRFFEWLATVATRAQSQASPNYKYQPGQSNKKQKEYTWIEEIITPEREQVNDFINITENQNRTSPPLIYITNSPPLDDSTLNSNLIVKTLSELHDNSQIASEILARTPSTAPLETFGQLNRTQFSNNQINETSSEDFADPETLNLLTEHEVVPSTSTDVYQYWNSEWISPNYPEIITQLNPLGVLPPDYNHNYIPDVPEEFFFQHNFDEMNYINDYNNTSSNSHII
ncbi:hypothetical protein G9A89_001311 [Geosiphon pyriformis]|nr:hypothetical protein G9A89_001311 [Geosiphon pyriformis]